MSSYDEHHPTWVIVAFILALGVGYIFMLCLILFATL